MKPLTPKQKAIGTNTYFIRAKIWFPDGSRVELEAPWVERSYGDELIVQLTRLVKRPVAKTNEEWEAEAQEGLKVWAETKKVEREFRRLPVVKDVDWVQQGTSRPQRGIIDNARDITFSRELTLKELEIAKKHLANDAFRRQKGWTGVGGYRTDARPEFTYRFTTTWDSSD